MVPFVYAILAALLLVLAWWLPGTATSALLGWGGAIALVLALRSGGGYRAMYLSGVLIQPLGFYWLYGTIKDFGGFPAAAAIPIFLLFVALSAVQYLIFLFVYRNLPAALDRWALRIAFAWVTAEVLSVRIFPWQWSHTQLGFPQLAQIADLGGTLLISLLMFWTAESVVRLHRERRPLLLLAPAALAAAVVYGQSRLTYFTQTEFPTQEVALVQANLPIHQKGDLKFFGRNLERYRLLTAGVASPDRLTIWPETVFIDFVAAGIGSVERDARLPFWPGAPLLIGALTFSSDTAIHNSALAIYPDGAVPVPYHKRILMPFGEYTPFAGIFPWLKEINATAAEFTAGTEVTVFAYPRGEGPPLQVAPLICYEDIVPALARSAVQAGATILVNLTNDAWFGNTVAPHQHHLIAAFRAIENRRALVRSTNSGLTAVVDPLGRTTATLPPFSEGVLTTRVPLVSETSFYTSTVGETPWQVVSLLALLVALTAGLRRRRSR